MSQNDEQTQTETATCTTSQPPAGYDHVHDIARPLEDVRGNGHSYYRVFSDWIDMLLASVQGDEEAYQEAIDEYSRDDLQLFAKAFAELQLAMDETQTEVLGDVYEMFGMSSDRLAQHFTPHTVAAGMAEMQVHTLDGDNDDVIRICDPTCGSGRMLVWAAREIHDKDDVEGFYFGQDKDPICAKMTALNLSFFNLEGQVSRGDSLTMNVTEGWRVHKTPFGSGVIEDIDTDEIPEAATSESE